MSLLLLSKFHRLECRSLRLVMLVSDNDAPARVSLSIKSFVRATASLCQNATKRRRGVNVDSLSRIENYADRKRPSMKKYLCLDIKNSVQFSITMFN